MGFEEYLLGLRGVFGSFWSGFRVGRLGEPFAIVHSGYQGGVCDFARLGCVVNGLLVGGWDVCVCFVVVSVFICWVCAEWWQETDRAFT